MLCPYLPGFGRGPAPPACFSPLASLGCQLPGKPPPAAITPPFGDNVLPTQALGQGSTGSEDILHLNSPVSAKKAWRRVVKLPQTALNIFPCLQPLCESLWQEIHTLYHTNLFTPSPPLLSQAGFSARSLLVGFSELWLVAQPQLGLHHAAMKKSSLTFLTEQALIPCPGHEVSVSWGCGICPSPNIFIHNNSRCSRGRWMWTQMDRAAEACVRGKERCHGAGQLAHPIPPGTGTQHLSISQWPFLLRWFHSQQNQVRNGIYSFLQGYGLLWKEGVRSKALLM